MSARDTAVIDTLFYDGDDHELMMQFPAMQEGVRSVHAMHLPMQMYGLLWAYDVSVERDPFGEMTLVGDLSALPDVVHDLIDRWAERMVATYQVTERIRDQRDYFTIADMPDRWWDGTRPDLVYPGLCFVKCWEWQARYGIAGATWVRAGIQLPAAWVSVLVPVRFGQSWLELPGGVTYNGVLQRFYRTDEWRKITLPTNESRVELSQHAARRVLPEARRQVRKWADNYPNHRSRLNTLLEDGTGAAVQAGESGDDDTLRWLIPDAA